MHAGVCGMCYDLYVACDALCVMFVTLCVWCVWRCVNGMACVTCVCALHDSTSHDRTMQRLANLVLPTSHASCDSGRFFIMILIGKRRWIEDCCDYWGRFAMHNTESLRWQRLLARVLRMRWWPHALTTCWPPTSGMHWPLASRRTMHRVHLPSP